METSNLFKAEFLLGDSDILRTLEQIRENLSVQTGEDVVSFDDQYSKLQRMVDVLPTLTLQTNIAEGGEELYLMQLAHAIDDINGDCDRVARQIMRFEGTLANAMSTVKRRSAEFNAWYLVAATQANIINKLKLPSSTLKELAQSEFSRLLDGKDEHIEAMMKTLGILAAEVKVHKKAQADKYKLGQDQANASWTSGMPRINGIDRHNPGKLLTKPRFEVENPDEDEVPFVSHDRVPEVEQETPRLLSRPVVDEEKDEDITPSTFFKTGQAQPTQVIEMPEEALTDKRELDEDVTLEETLEFEDDGVVEPEPEVEVTIPEPTVVEDFEDDFVPAIKTNVLDTPTPSTPRRRLMFLSDEEDIL